MARVQVPVSAAYILEPVAIISSISLTYLNHTRQRRSSTVLLLFWPLYTISVAIWLRTRHAVELGIFFPLVVGKAAVIGLGLLAFGLECMGPEYGAEQQLGDKLDIENPILTANIFSIWVNIIFQRFWLALIGPDSSLSAG